MTTLRAPEPFLTPFKTGARLYCNPVAPGDFPDPFVLEHDGVYYAYATNHKGVDLPVRTSTDLANWEVRGDAMGPLPKWAKRGFTWAPDVMKVEGGFMLYYTVRHRKSGLQVIGAAFSKSPLGPFVDTSAGPLIAQIPLGGAIDAHAFVDEDGRRYLYWKNDGNALRQKTWLWVQRLSENGRQLLGEPRRLLVNDQPWERHLIEAPFVLRRGGKYHLFYSAAHYGDSTYGVGHAVADTPTGPFVKTDGPILRSTRDVAGPGGQGVLTDALGQTWMYYHAWTPGKIGYERKGERSMRLDPLAWDGDRPAVLRPSVTAMFSPATPMELAAD